MHQFGLVAVLFVVDLVFTGTSRNALTFRLFNI
jgi:hypothetical protein